MLVPVAPFVIRNRPVPGVLVPPGLVGILSLETAGIGRRIGNAVPVVVHRAIVRRILKGEGMGEAEEVAQLMGPVVAAGQGISEDRIRAVATG